MNIGAIDHVHMPRVDRTTPAPQNSKELRQAATKLVSSALVAPALASMHESPLRPSSGPFAQSSVEKRFGPLLQIEFADRIAAAGSYSLVDSIVKRFEARNCTEVLA